ncbi:MAG: hypothetical protein D6731_01190 [Planctomycetota bacterium]|nr:MAG: hypothetical protein D6731_01190 [Planctomycetota bacterium]
MLHPYAQSLVARLADQDRETERVRRQGEGAVNPQGLTAEEIVHFVWEHGERTLSQLSRDLHLETSVLECYLRVLVRRQQVTLTRDDRGGWVVSPGGTGRPRRAG